MAITINRVTVPAMTVVALRGTVPTYSDEPMLWERMMPAVTAQGLTPAGPCGVIEHDPEYTERDVDLSIFLPVAPGTVAEAPLEILELPERDCLMARVVGPYSQITEAHDRINARLVEEGLSVSDGDSAADRAFNLYLTTMDQVPPEELITEVYEPLA